MRHLATKSIGQEAVAAAAGVALRKDDLMVSAHRAHGHYLAKGGDLKAMLAEIYGKVTGCSRGKGGSMHLVDRRVGFVGSTAIVGGTAVGEGTVVGVAVAAGIGDGLAGSGVTGFVQAETVSISASTGATAAYRSDPRRAMSPSHQKPSPQRAPG